MARKRKLRSDWNVTALLAGAFVVAFASCFLLNASADYIEDGTKLDLDSKISYSIVTRYDGVDASGAMSNASRAVDLYSDRIIVTNEVPRGMIFDAFSQEAGQYVARNAETGEACKGKVVDLAYDEASRIVNYAVEGLQAGCEIVVGVNVRTPQKVEDESTKTQDMRRDFYNLAEAIEGTEKAQSNLTHSFIGNNTVPLYKVKYEYTGDTPYGAPKLPEETRYARGAIVGVAPIPVVPGYTFSGWSTSGVSEGTKSFAMPSNDVVLTGVFVKDVEAEYYKVSYRISGEVPTGYVVPATKTVAAGTAFTLDQLTKEYAPEDYGFGGWMTADADVNSQSFVMPNHDVEILGTFTPLHPLDADDAREYTQSHSVSYKSNLPTGCKDYKTIPAQKSYVTGSAVHVSTSKPICDGYTFKGWQIDAESKIKFINEDYFEMPSEDITLRAVWSKISVEIR